MQIIDERHVRVVCGDIELDCDCDPDGVPDTVQVVHKDGARTLAEWCMPAEVLERAAAAVQLARHRAHDKRLVCADHGYFADTSRSEAPAPCLGCARVMQAQDSAARLVPGGGEGIKG